MGGVRTYRPHGPDERNVVTPRARRVLYVPVRAAHGPVGVMGVAAVRATDFSADERRLLTTFAEPGRARHRSCPADRGGDACHRCLKRRTRLNPHSLAAVSHDLRTPLASIKAAATSLLQEEVPWDQETRREFLHGDR